MKILKIIIIFAVFFTAAEVICRLVMPSYVRIIDNRTKRRLWMSEILESSKKGKRFKPNLDLTVYNAWISHWPKLAYRTNSLGLRGQEIIIKEPDIDYRILVLGDSITWSGYLPEEGTYVFQLGNLLRQELHGNIRVINAGIGDVGITEELGFLKEVCDKLKPKMVILGFYLNDSRPSFGFESEKGLSWVKFLQKSRFIDFLYGNARLQIYLMRSGVLGKGWRYRWFYLSKDPRWKIEQAYFKEMAREADLDWGAAWDESSWEIVYKNIADLKKFSDSKGFKLAIVCFPVSFQVYADFLDDFPQQKMQELCSKYKIPFLDLLPQFRQNNKIELFYDACHLNAQGQRMAAEELARFILDRKLIPR